MTTARAPRHDREDDPRLVAQTPEGSTIEALEDGRYRVCLPQGPCQTVSGLHRANDLLYWSEQTRPQKNLLEG
ncbi:hypothetical protein [Vulcanococcus sp.]|jgi:hypothetical protein|uniref:hypothetical protein n=1 Tax=Vulcanococcus sp. TaxID=2856995 RepID=UPI00322A7262